MSDAGCAESTAPLTREPDDRLREYVSTRGGEFTLAAENQPVNATASFSRASALEPVHPRHPLTSMQDEAFVSVQASTHRHLPGPLMLVSLPVPVLVLTTLRELPLPWACDQSRVP